MHSVQAKAIVYVNTHENKGVEFELFYMVERFIFVLQSIHDFISKKFSPSFNYPNNSHVNWPCFTSNVSS